MGMVTLELMGNSWIVARKNGMMAFLWMKNDVGLTDTLNLAMKCR
jgi:hypothetical protein